MARPKHVPGGYILFLSRLDKHLFEYDYKWLGALRHLNQISLNHSVLKMFLTAKRLRAPNKIEQNELPKINVICPIIRKDFHLIQSFLENVVKYSLNDIERITLVTRSEEVDELLALTVNVPSVQIVSEDSIVPLDTRHVINSLDKNRRGWVLQMAIKFSAVHKSSQEYNLVIDPDTIPTSTSTWVNAHGISGVFPTYHDSNLNSEIYEAFPNLGIATPREECFVSHMMVWRREYVSTLIESFSPTMKSNSQKIEGQRTNFELGLRELFLFGHKVVDWQLYADYVTENFPQNVERLKWSNLAIYNGGVSSGGVNHFLAKYDGIFRTLSFHTHTVFNK